MSRTYADVTLVGRLRDRPTLQTVGDHQVGHMTLAVDRPGKDAGTDFFNVTTWNRQAEACNQYLEKGNLVLVKGRPEIHEWEKDGAKHRSFEVRAQDVRFLERQNSAPANDGPER